LAEFGPNLYVLPHYGSLNTLNVSVCTLTGTLSFLIVEIGQVNIRVAR